MDLIFDTETTGFAPKGCTDPADPRQPHVVQIALAHRERSTGRIVNAAKFLLCPDHWKSDEPQALLHWEIPAGATAVHGITAEHCRLQGIPASKGLALFRIMAQLATRLVAFNIPYDWSILEALAVRSNVGLQALPRVPHFCVMEATTPLCKLPPTDNMIKYGRASAYKPPKLQEAYKILVDPAGFSQAHDAFADVSATNAILNVLEEKDRPNAA